MSPLFTFFFLYMWSLRDLLLHILIGRSHSLLHRIENNTVRTQNSNLICQGWRGVYRNPWLAKMSETCLNQTLSKPKTCLSQTDFTVPSTKSLCNLNLCKPNYCLNWTNSSVPKGFGLDRFYCISQWTRTISLLFSLWLIITKCCWGGGYSHILCINDRWTVYSIR